ncbi:MAG: hypothetical protein QM783_13600 [Phycisphaerales bacterium]
MPIEIRTGRIEFPSGTGLRAAAWTYFVDRFPRACWVAMSGYKARYDSSDHHIKMLQVELTTSMGVGEFGPAIYVTAKLQLRDKNADDPFSGWVDYVLFCDTSRPGLDPSILHAGAERWSL